MAFLKLDLPSKNSKASLAYKNELFQPKFIEFGRKTSFFVGKFAQESDLANFIGDLYLSHKYYYKK